MIRLYHAWVYFGRGLLVLAAIFAVAWVVDVIMWELRIRRINRPMPKEKDE